MALVHFLLVFNRSEQQLIEQKSFTRSAAAVSAYEKFENHYRGDRNIEIVLVGADSIDSVMLTHGNYFDGIGSSSPYLAGV